MSPHQTTLLAVVSALVMTTGFASDTVTPYTTKVVLPEGSKAGRTLSVYLPAGKLRIDGADGNTLYATGRPVEAPTVAHSGDAPVPLGGKRASKTKMIQSDEPPAGLVFWVREGGFDLTVGESNGPLDVRVSVPREMAIHVESQSAQEIVVSNMDGEISISANQADIVVEGSSGSIVAETVEGSIRLLDIAGPVEANTDFGRIDATLREVSPEKPVWLSAAVGPIDIALPDTADADLHMRSTWGEVYNDFDESLGAREDDLRDADQPSRMRAPAAAQMGATKKSPGEKSEGEARLESAPTTPVEPEEMPAADKLQVRGGRSEEVQFRIDGAQPPRRYVGRIGVGGVDIRLVTGSKHIRVRRLKTK